MAMLKQEFDDTRPIRFTRSSNSTQNEISKKRRRTIFDDSSDDVEDKGNQVDQDDNQVIDQSPDHEYHLDQFVDDLPLHNEQDTSRSRKDKYALIDEVSDEDLYNKNSTSDDGVWVNVNDLPYASPDVRASDSLFEDEAEEELEESDINSVSSASGEDDLQNFIDDEDQDDEQSTDDYVPTTDDESSDDDV